jgi:peptide/nickel transport system substrate-binding protein
MRYPPRLLAVLLSASLLGLAACSSSGTSATSSSSADPVSGGTLVLADDSPPTCIDVQQSTLFSTLRIGRMITDSLTDQQVKTGKIVPWLATSWKINSNATSYTFYLRKGVTFSNGEPFNATAVKDNFDGIIALGALSAYGASYLAGYTGTTVVSNYEAVVHFSKPNFEFLQETATPTLGVYAPSVFKEPAADRCEGTGLVGSGPFILTSDSPNTQVTLKRREGYNWPSSLRDHSGDAYLAGIDIKIVTENTVRDNGVAAGQFDASADLEPQDQSSAKAAGDVIEDMENPGIVPSLMPNEKQPILNDINVRRAIQQAINRKQILATLYNTGNYQEATSVLQPTTPGYANESSLLGYDPAAAEKLLTADGWKVGPGGIRVKDGKTLTLGVIAETSEEPLLELVQSQLKTIGVNLQINIVSDIFTTQSTGNYDFFNWSYTRASPDALRTVFDSTNPVRKGQAFDTAFNQLAEEAASTDNTAVADPLYAQEQRLLIENGDDIPLVTQAQVWAVSPKVHGWQFEASSMANFYDVWLSK